MTKRRETPDNILNDVQPGPAPANRQAVIPARQHTGTEDAGKVKLTHYLSAEAADALDAAWLDLRRQASAAQRNRVTKSAIVEAALQLALADLDALARRLL